MHAGCLSFGSPALTFCSNRHTAIGGLLLKSMHSADMDMNTFYLQVVNHPNFCYLPLRHSWWLIVGKRGGVGGRATARTSPSLGKAMGPTALYHHQEPKATLLSTSVSCLCKSENNKWAYKADTISMKECLQEFLLGMWCWEGGRGF